MSEKWTRQDAFDRVNDARFCSLDPQKTSIEYIIGLEELVERWLEHIRAEKRLVCKDINNR